MNAIVVLRKILLVAAVTTEPREVVTRKAVVTIYAIGDSAHGMSLPTNLTLTQCSNVSDEANIKL